MLNVEIVSKTYSTFSFTIPTGITFDEVVMYISEKDSMATILVDKLGINGNTNKNPILTRDQNGIFHVDINRVSYTTVFYKDFYFALFDGSAFIDQTYPVSIAPKVEPHFLGIVNKLNNDYDIEVRFSGTTGRMFKADIQDDKCDCWDPVLKQSDNSSCELCNGTGTVISELIPVDFTLKRIKSSRSEFIAEKGKEIISQNIFLTYSRLDFSIGHIFLDLNTHIFYEIKNANIAHIGGIRTSTRIVALRVPSNDSRVVLLPSS